MKKTFCALFLLAMTLFCFGFKSDGDFDFQQKNAFRICRFVTNEGKSSISYIFPVNSERLTEGFSEEEISQYKFYLGAYVNAFAKNYKKKIIDGVAVESSIYYKDVDGYGFSIIFENENAQKKFFAIEDETATSSTTHRTTGFFVKKTMLETNFPISNSSAETLRLVCYMAVEAWAKDNNVGVDKKNIIIEEIKNCKFIYDFATQQQSLKSEKMYRDEIFYHNFFIKSYEDLLAGEGIVFWVKSANRPVWYFSALIFVGASMALMWIFKKKI